MNTRPLGWIVHGLEGGVEILEDIVSEHDVIDAATFDRLVKLAQRVTKLCKDVQDTKL